MIRFRINLIIILISLLSTLSSAQIGQLEVISPNGGETLTTNNRYGISWISQGVERINIYYTTEKNSNWVQIAEGVPTALGHFSWKTPDVETNLLKIKIESVANSKLYDISNDFAKIVAKQLKKSSAMNNQTIKILPLGNSITFDNRKNDTRAVEDKIGYRYPLYLLLKNGGYNFEFIGSESAGSNFFPEEGYDANAGFPGIYDYELNNLLETGILNLSINGRLDTLSVGPYLNTYQPDIILLHIGTNGNDAVEGTSEVDVENILDNIDDYELAHNKQVVVFLARIVNRVPNESYVTNFNNNVESMVLDRINNPLNDAYPDIINIVDIQNISGFNYTISPDPNGSPGDMNDQLHPNDNGYSKIANTWFDALESYYNQQLLVINQPESIYVIEGENGNFSISVSGNKPISYQWKRNGVELIGKTDSVLSLQNISLSDSGAIYSCTVTNFNSSIKSGGAQVIVTAENNRVVHGLQVLYNFNDGFGNKILDESSLTDTLNLNIDKPEDIIWNPQSLVVIGDSNIKTEKAAKQLYDSIVASNEMTLEAWIKPINNDPQNSARIATYSEDDNSRNFSLIQNQNKFEFRLRTTNTDNNGLPSVLSSAQVSINKLMHIVYTISTDDTARLFINGSLDVKNYIGGSFANWDSSYSFGISNEIIENNPWLGSFYLLSVYNRSLSSNEIGHNYSLGVDNINKNIIAPSNLSASANSNNIELGWSDNSNIESGYILRRKISDSSFKIINITGPNQISFVDTQLKEGRTYTYSVSSFNNLGESFNSNLASITTELPKPSNLDGTLDNDDFVVLLWEDNSQGESGFIIEGKADFADSSYRQIAIVDSNIVSHIDNLPKYFSPYVYRVSAFTRDLTSASSNEFKINIVNVDNIPEIPISFALKQNYPNPFNPSTTIEYSIPREAFVNLDIYDILGQKVFTLVNKKLPSGNYKVDFNASKFNSGVYFYVLKASSIGKNMNFKDVKKLLLIK